MPKTDPNAPPGRQIWLDGQLVPWAEATVHVLSHSLQRGSLVFDYTSVHATPRGDAIFRLREHLERFEASCELVGLELHRTTEDLAAACAACVRANPNATALKISAYLPSVEVDVVPLDERVSVAIAVYDPIRDVIERKGGGARLKTEYRVWLEKERRNRRRDIVEPQAKVAANYVSPMVAKWRAKRAGYDEVLLLDAHGEVAEGPTTNVFLVEADGSLVTPPEDHVLHGVTRRSLLEIAKHDGRPARVERVVPDALFEAAEVFLSGTTAGVMPVIAIDDFPIGDGRPGPVSVALRERYHAITRGADPAFLHWLTFVDEA
jgi:branched-chain amino acid aminotransferase